MVSSAFAYSIDLGVVVAHGNPLFTINTLDFEQGIIDKKDTSKNMNVVINPENRCAEMKSIKILFPPSDL